MVGQEWTWPHLDLDSLSACINSSLYGLKPHSLYLNFALWPGRWTWGITYVSVSLSKRYPLELELQMVVSCLMGSGYQNWVFCKSSQGSSWQNHLFSPQYDNFNYWRWALSLLQEHNLCPKFRKTLSLDAVLALLCAPVTVGATEHLLCGLLELRYVPELGALIQHNLNARC